MVSSHLFAFLERGSSGSFGCDPTLLRLVSLQRAQGLPLCSGRLERSDGYTGGEDVMRGTGWSCGEGVRKRELNIPI